MAVWDPEMETLELQPLFRPWMHVWAGPGGDTLLREPEGCFPDVP